MNRKLIIKFAAAYKSRYICSVICAVISEILGMVPYFAVAAMITALLAGKSEVLFFLGWCLAAAGGYIGKGLFSGISTSISHEATFRTMKQLRRQLIAKLSRMPMGNLLNTPSGYYKDVIADRVEGMETPLAHLLPELIANILVPLMMLIYLITIDWRMALITLVTVPVGLIVMRTTMGSYQEKYEGSVRVSNEMTNAIVEYMGGIEVIKAFSQSARSYAKYSDAVKDNAAYFYNWMKSAQWGMSCYTAITPTVLLPVLPIGYVFYINGSLTAAELVTVIVLAMGVVGPLITASNYVDNMARVSTVAGQIQDILTGPELVRPEKPVELAGRDIIFDDVTFSYQADQEEAALEHVSLKIPQGTVTALTGPSGSGKSTMAKLISGFWDVNQGNILIGGQNVQDIPQKQLSDQIAYVSQDNYLFDDTIRENIRMGRSGATDQEVEQAAKDAGCDKFIRSLEKGYDTVVGGAGGHLSGGERQRIAIARAMLKNAPVIILDEATAYVDPENEAVIQEAVSRLVAGKTLLVIAHRLSTITDADQIVVMNAGKVSDSGSHEELLEKSELYQHMWQAHIGAKDGEEL